MQKMIMTESNKKWKVFRENIVDTKINEYRATEFQIMKENNIFRENIKKCPVLSARTIMYLFTKITINTNFSTI